MPMKALFTLTIVLLVIHSKVSSHTRTSRSIVTNYEGRELAIDLIATSLRESIVQLCATGLCDTQSTVSTIESWLDRKSCGVIEDSFAARETDYSNVHSPGSTDDRRVDSIDRSVLQNYYAAQLEAKSLLIGELTPRNACILSSNAGNNCKFARYVAAYGLKSPVQIQGNTSFHSYIYLFELVDDLFNAQLYDHAEAWCSFLMRSLLPPLDMTRQGDSFSLANLKSNDLILLNRGSLVLSEIARLKGHLELATHHSMRVIRCYQLLSGRQNVPDFDPKHNVALISRLRILLTIPPTPPDYATAKFYRQQMMEDLAVFMEDVKKRNETISLEDLSSHVSAMPFNMAHQGLNDASLQHILCKVLTTICPELVYLSPHLRDNASRGNADHATNNSKDGNLNNVSEAETKEDVYRKQTVHKVLKVGFISTNFFDHSIGRILVELFLQLKQQIVFDKDITYSLDVHVFTIDRRLPYATNIIINNTNASPTIEYDAETLLHMHHDVITRILSEHLQHKAIRLPDNIRTIRKVLDATRLDILVFTDVGMDFSTYQLAFGRFAPVQAAWWGHPITPSLPSIDYFITLYDEIPTADAHYNEQTVRMEHINTVPLASPYSTRLSKVLDGFYGRHSTSNINANDNLTPHDAEAMGDLYALTSLNFPVNSDLVVVLGRLFKLHPAFDELLVTLLLDLYAHDENVVHTKDDHSNSSSTATYIVLIAESLFELNTIILKRLTKAIDTRILNTANASSINGTALVAKYIRFVGYNHYYTILRSAKVVLDTHPYGGCLTSHDALSHHVPIVTLPSEYIRGRFTLGMYRNMNMTSLVAKDSTEFNVIILKLLSDEDYWLQLATEVKQKFARLVTTNNLKVAQEWAEFFVRVLSQ